MIFKESGAVALFNSPLFLSAWDDLWHNCPWATVFQHQDFVINWFKLYPSYSPIVVTDWDGQKLSGVLVVTFKDKKEITAAGFDQAEYQTWISYPASGNDFIQTSILALRNEFPKVTLHFKYLPSHTPLAWLKDFQILKGRYFRKEYEQPLMFLNKEQLEAELKKKNRKEKINRLKRIGDLQFVELSKVSEFEMVIDEMILQNDFRKGALYGKMVFQEEFQRREFLLKMFELGHLHVSLLKLDEKVIASNAGFIGEDVIHLQGINSHSPFFSKYSPGILLFLMLGVQLSEKGKKYFDLTPGGIDGYKSMLSNFKEEVHELWISNRKFIFSMIFREKVKNWVLAISEKSGFFSAAVSTYRDKIKGRRTSNNLNGLNLNSPRKLDDKNSKRDKINFNLISISLATEAGIDSLSIKRNQISDLFLFGVEERKLDKRNLFSDSLKKIEMGYDLITVVQDEKLKAVLWLMKLQGKNHLENSESRSTFDALGLFFSFYEKSCLNEILFSIKQNIQYLFPEIENVEGIPIELSKEEMDLIGDSLFLNTKSR
ncbi:GNAT family N-acetyltransferase [Aquiflexum gelatinilyticum]|uniref:GNAT family N-acetyltransferase n=1 Tax=Aquiflexum gelatinilyticum TaxID=2961943 RepID=UPI00216AAA4F|nr:GNAT family N-acetyltransferase [Aquiflexum gelatinilyticum]MCS4436616.1 GNAT family N-acetyltransferase [Aquiflexum gelatinilyticum]